MALVVIDAGHGSGSLRKLTKGSRYPLLSVEKIVPERVRKGRAVATQKIEIYINFIGEYIPPTMAEKEPTPGELNNCQRTEPFII